MVVDGVGVLVDPYVSSCIAVPGSCFLSRLPDAIFGGVRLGRLAFGLAGGLLGSRGPGSLVGDSRGWGGSS